VLRTNDREKLGLWFKLGQATAHRGLPLLHFDAARGTAMRLKRVQKTPQYGFGIASESQCGHAKTLRLLGIGVDPDNGKLAIDSPLGEAGEEPRVDREHQVGLAPQFAASGSVTLKGLRLSSTPRPRR